MREVTVCKLRDVAVSIAIIFSMSPAFLWSLGGVANLIALALIGIGYFFELVLLRNSLQFKKFLFLYLLYIVYTNLVGVNLSRGFIDSLTIISFLVLSLSYDTLFSVFKKFFEIFGVLLALSLLFYFLKIFSLLNLPYSIAIAPDSREYLSYPLNVLLAFEQTNAFFIATGFYRFYSFLNEPGFIGTISALIIVAYKYNFRRNKLLFVYLMAAIMSFSLASYITLFLGLMLTLQPRKILISSVLVIGIISLNSLLFERFIVGRINSGTGSVDNRTSPEFDKKWEEIKGDIFDFTFGKGKSQHSSLGEGGVSSWKSIVYNSGVIGMIIYLLLFISIFTDIKSRNRYTYIVLLAFLITIYHRPNLTQSYYLLIFVFGLINSYNKAVSYNEKTDINSLNIR